MIFFCAIFPICVGKVARFNLTGISTRERGNLPFELDPIKKIITLDHSTPRQNCRLPRPFAKPIHSIPQSPLAKGLAVTKPGGGLSPSANIRKSREKACLFRYPIHNANGG
jgi:hypothetical protein